jgi:chloramphenicol 3-O-phosphotransferase
MVAPGPVVVINGTSSAGKTTLAETFQETRAKAGECWVVFGIDDFMPRLPRRWVAIDAWSGSLAADGVRLDAAGREAARGDRARGLVRGLFDIVHRYPVYDLELDSTATSPADLADELAAYLGEPATRAE